MKGTTWRSGPMLLGYALTVLVLGGFAGLALQEVCVQQAEHVQICQSRWEGLLDAPFNEVGDTLAGFAGALAFVWLIVTVLIQGLELAAQREELKLAREVQEEQLKAMNAQSKIFEEEQRQRDQTVAKDHFDELLVSLLSLRETLLQEGLSWGFARSEEAFLYSRPEQSHVVEIFPKTQGMDLAEEGLYSWARHLRSIAGGMAEHFASAEFVSLARRKDLLAGVYAIVEAILDLGSRLSPAQSLRLMRLNLYSVPDLLEEIEKNPALWAESEDPQ